MKIREHCNKPFDLYALKHERLNPEIRQAAYQHIEQCHYCRAELTMMETLSEVIEEDVSMNSTDAAFDRVIRDIDVLEGQQHRQCFTLNVVKCWLDKQSDQYSEAILKALAIGQFAVIVLLSAVLWLQWDIGRPQTTEYHLLSDKLTATTTEQKYFRVVFAPSATMENVANILGAIDGEIIRGPSPAGVYDIEFSEHTDPLRAQKILKENHQVLFVELLP